MAGDWIKVRTNLANHPKVVTLSSRLGVTKTHTIGALVTLWSQADAHADDGVLESCSLETIDALTELPGFGDAMVLVGWLVVGDVGVELPNYTTHNGHTAKYRAQGAKRAQSSRDRNAAVTPDRSKSEPREEKRREEKRRSEKRKETKTKTPPPPKSEPPIPESLDTGAFRTSWGEWREHRKALDGKDPTHLAKTKALNMLAKWGPDRAIAAIDHSIAANWKGIFERDQKGANNGSASRQAQERKQRRADEYEQPPQDIPYA